MHARLLKALVSVSAVSTEAKNLAGQLISSESPELVKQLQAKIAALEAQVCELTMQLLPDDEELSEKEVIELTAIITARLAEADAEALALYTRQYFFKLENAIRVIVAKALIDRAVALKTNPAEFWLDVVALNGDIK